ncbi:hypothetical protein AQUSIP_20310 [Aquicella siphonis]|uniref:Uncharacterized protein n=1 Tax=Aquicella siphonis TaxID=254247 RepID=A0A5E4PKE6_9COXI|nr:hypothetical protein [Aquicella siphonis]VVC76706.1 hypothetical protein AQUSIP_20310 [Aquicella siphonis]
MNRSMLTHSRHTQPQGTQNEAANTQTCLIHEVEINRLDAEQVIQYAEQSQKTRLDYSQQEEIRKTFAKDPLLTELVRLHNQFIDIMARFNMLPGLDEKQVRELHRLIQEVREFKMLRQKGDVSMEAIKKVVANEKALLPLNHVIEWWSANQDSLKKLELWENMTDMIVNDSGKKHEEDQAARSKIHHLIDIKNDWISHQFFCGYSSEKLLEFYQNFIRKIEGWLNEALDPQNSQTKKWHPAIRNYLGFLRYEVKKLKKSAVQSMYFRLACAEYYHDIKMDDLITHVCGMIKDQCGINILGTGKKPDARRSLTPGLMADFLKVINKYCEDNPSEKSILYNLRQFRMQNIPRHWKSMCEDENTLTGLRAYPVFLFSANTLPLLIEEAHQDVRLASNALKQGKLEDKGFVLNKLKSLMKYMAQEERRIAGQKPGALRDLLIKSIQDQNKVYARFLEELSIKFEIEVKSLVSDLTDHILSGARLNAETLSCALDQIRQARLFFRNFPHEHYHSGSDLFLALASRIKHLILSNHDLTPEQINNIIEFIPYISPKKNDKDYSSLKKALAKVSDSAKKLHEENEAGLLHLLVNILESPSLTQDSLATAVKRHQHIAETYGEEWSPAFTITPGMTTEQIYLFSICAYVKNVMLKISALSPYIDFGNFDDNEILTLFNNIRQDCERDIKQPMIRKDVLASLRAELERCILARINDFFMIKSYLYLPDADNISVNRLALLLTRINEFFTNIECRKIILESLSKSILSLVKQYCIRCVEKNEKPDMEYFSNISTLAGEDLIAGLGGDEDMIKILSAFADTYDGTTPYLEPLLTRLFAKLNTPAQNSIITRFAKRRLDYILHCQEADPDDYLFFSQYSSQSVISGMLQSARRQFAPVIQSSLADAAAAWKPAAASIIELFGDEKSVYAYRMKKILELISLSAPGRIDDRAAKILFEIFTSTLNSRISIENHILDIKTPVDSHFNLKTYLDHLIAGQTWSFMLEQVVHVCGSQEQKQELHLRHTLHYLDNPADFSAAWLGQALADAQTRRPDDREKEVRFYTQFYGEKNIKRLTDRISLLLRDLIEANHHLDSREITRFEYKNLLTVIACVKPLASLYTIYGNNREAKTFLSGIDEMKKKIQLHYQMHTVIKQQSSLLGISENHVELHNLILSIIQTITKIERKQILSDQNINQYLAFFDNEILRRVDIILSRHESTLDFQVLFTLANLMRYLASDNMKLLLLNANLKHLEDNPYWYTLINHLDEKNSVAELEKLSRKPDAAFLSENDFRHALLFAKHLTRIKSRTHQLIKLSLIKEAGVDSVKPESRDFNSMLIDARVKDKHLLRLWNACADKLLIENLNPHVKVQYVHFMIRLLAKVSDAILARARNQHSLLKSYLSRLPQIEKIQSSMQALDQQMGKVQLATQNRFLWQDRTEFEKSAQPLMTSVYKAVSLELMHKIEKYLLHIINKNQLDSFKQYCNDAEFHENRINALTTLPELKKTFALKHDADAARMAGLISLYALLGRTLIDGKNISLVSTCLEQLMTEPKSNPRLPNARPYISLLREMRAVTEKYFHPVNDRGQNKKSIFPSSE